MLVPQVSRVGTADKLIGTARSAPRIRSVAFKGNALTERGVSLMSKNKKILLAVAKGGMSQPDIAALLHVSKRDVSAAAKP